MEAVNAKLWKQFHEMEDRDSLIQLALKLAGGDSTRLAERLGIKERTLLRIRSGELPLSPQIEAHLRTLIQIMAPDNGSPQSQNMIAEDSTEYRLPLRRVPVLSWAHAGEAASYEELPQSWQESVPSMCADPKAFGLTVEGDSMQPNYQAGDVVIVMPSVPPRNGCLVVAKLKTDGIVFRRFHVAPGDTIRLTAYNPIYPPFEGKEENFHWIYPVHSTVKPEWR